ncbi:hypothetical protein SAMN05443575_2417 [Jatrophihabitans endophyticus]|uniref:Uncharacterized protein n=1 Tax=Jatrophihabitans endophyticus TaxID=1206085 RepID=A0A1M5LCV1_9ACTN|nr:hypothetical protein [Jatrophihabitans endophyticus]SHG62932.1 hypothetical protein SAMN05443575_2417 [Jatrophihabitans endophyticus]
MTALRTLALVESATQLLNVVEWAHATGETADLRIAVLCPKDSPTRGQLREVGALAAGSGLNVDLVDIRALGSGGLLGGVRLTRSLSAAHRVVLGDPFSGLIQTLLPFVRAEHVVVVDDGTATWEFAACVDSGAPLVRWRLEARGATPRAARATRLLSPGAHRTLTVFSCLTGATPVGAAGIVNRYGWTRSQGVPQVRADEIDVVGASLVETGVVDRAAYLAALARLAARATGVRYLAHRRESENRLAEIAALPNVRVQRGRLPVELTLRQGPVAAHVITFPSTAAHTLPVVLGDLSDDATRPAVRVEVRRVEDAWFTPSTGSHARDFVTRIGTDAPARPVLEPA